MAQYTITNQPAPIDFEGGGDYTKRVLQRAKNLLMTAMGEVPYDRLRGFDAALYDLPIQEMRENLLPEADRMMLWEPDVEVVEAECALLPDGKALITLIVEVTE